MEQRCDGEGHEAIVPQCAHWVFPVTPCRSRFKDSGKGGGAQTVMGDGVPEMHTETMELCVYVSLCMSPEQFVLLTKAVLMARGEKGIGTFCFYFIF